MPYPTSVFSPASRSNGQTIDASHVNDLQTEVTAVEDALLGTITHSVNVSGASTLATLQAAASTFSVRPVTPPPDFIKVFITNQAAIGSSAASTLSFTSQDVAINAAMHSTGTNPERLTPQSTGMYFMAAQVAFTATTGASPGFEIQDSSNGTISLSQHDASSRAAYLQATGYKRFDSTGGYARVVLTPSGYSTLTILSGVANTWFAMQKL